MAKKRKPDFSKPKEVSQKDEFLNGNNSQEIEQPDFINPQFMQLLTENRFIL